MNLKATLSRPTGFSDPSHFYSEVVVHGFTWGKHADARGYNRSDECALAVCSEGDGALYTVPLRWLKIHKNEGQPE
jgi:hypothetical protein